MTLTDDAVGYPALDDDPFGEDVVRDPYDFYERLRAAGPVVELTRYGVLAVGRYADLTAVLSDPVGFCSSRGVGIRDLAVEDPWRQPSLLVEADPPEHGRARGLMAQVLARPVVEGLRAAFTACAERLVEEAVQRGSFDAVQALATPFPLQAFPDAVGITGEDRELVLPYANHVFNAFGPRNRILLDGEADLARTSAWVDAACRRERLAPGGLGAAVWAFVDTGDLEPDEAFRLTRTLLSAGVDTTVVALGNALQCLAAAPDQWALLHADPGLARRAFEECLRVESPVQKFFRTTTAPRQVGGVPVAADRKVLCVVASGNRDPRKWGGSAGVLDITRRPAGHLSFGGGVHACIGQAIARLEGECLLAALATRVRSIELTAPPVPHLNNALKGWDSIPVAVTPA
jgi:4-methoxybenzoate monooxygenase (O-demethylating)